MVEVNEALTRKVADLARLELSDPEVKTFTSQLGEILKYVDQLTQVSVKGPNGVEVEPLTHPLDLDTPMREDAVRPSLLDEHGKPSVLKCAPDVVNDGFKVPPIL